MVTSTERRVANAITTKLCKYPSRATSKGKKRF
jgi:hypothetical protein